MKPPFRLDVSLIVLVLLIDLFNVAITHAAENGNFAGLVDIGDGRKMYLKCSGRGSPTVVLVGGLRASADDWSISDKSKPTVFSEVGKFTRVCACDRPGTPVGEKPSRSDPVPQPTTPKDAVADLHALLSASGEAGPFVLIGHSYGFDRQALCEHLSKGSVWSRANRRSQRRTSGRRDTRTMGDPAKAD